MSLALRGLRTALSAIANGSTVPVTPDIVLALLRGEGREPSHLRALFGDVDVATLERVAAGAGLPPSVWLAAYAEARRTAGAANPELDALLADNDASSR